MRLRYLFAAALLALGGCVTSSSGAYKRADGNTVASCLDTCIERTGNQEACALHAKEARKSCGELIQMVCAAETSGGCGEQTQ